jgi:hypothetical protein
MTIKEPFVAIGLSSRELLKTPAVIGAISLLYALLLGGIYLFISTGVATLSQVLLTFATALFCPLLLLFIQAAAARYAAGETSVVALATWSLRNFWKVLVISIPLIALAVLTIYLLNRLQSQFVVPPATPARLRLISEGVYSAPPPPLQWHEVLVSSLRLLLLGIAIPLTGAHLWIELARSSFIQTIKGVPRSVARAVSTRSVMIYLIGAVLFGVMPYFFLFTRTPVKNGWGELIVFGLRGAVAFTFTLCGWLITLRALAGMDGTREVPGEAQPAAEFSVPEPN